MIERKEIPRYALFAVTNCLPASWINIVRHDSKIEYFISLVVSLLKPLYQT
jgi:hypothetical protein